MNKTPLLNLYFGSECRSKNGGSTSKSGCINNGNIGSVTKSLVWSGCTIMDSSWSRSGSGNI